MAGSDNLPALGGSAKSSMSDVIKVTTYEFHGSCGGVPLPTTARSTIIKDHSADGVPGGCSGGCGKTGRKAGDYSTGDSGNPDFRIHLGKGLRGESSGYLSLNFEEPDAMIDTPEGLRLPVVRDDLEVAKNGTGSPRQVMGMEAFVDIVSNSAHEYEVRVYHPQDVLPGGLCTNIISFNSSWNNVQPQYVLYSGGTYQYPVKPIKQYAAPDGIYQPKTGHQPFATYRVKGNYVTNEFQSLEISRLLQVGGVTTTNVSTYGWDNASTGGWTLVEGAGSDIRKRSERKYQDGDDWFDEKIVRDGNDVVASRKVQTWRDLGAGLVKVREESGEGASTQVTDYGYSGGLLSGVVNSDGSWERYAYDAQGRKTNVVATLFNADSNAAPGTVRQTVYDYVSLDPSNDVLVVNPSDARTVTERVGGVVVDRTFHAYYENEGGERVEITERCADASSGYGSSSNQRTQKVYYPMNVLNSTVADGRLKTVQYPDGRKDSYSYVAGTYTTNADPALCAFSVTTTGDYIRVSVVHGTSDATNGVAYKSVKDVRIEDETSHVLQEESYVYTGSGYERIAWTVYTLDELGRTLLARRSDGSQVNTSWACCGKDTETDVQGGIHNFTYDALKRVTSEEKEGTTAGEYPAQENQFTEYTYDAEGRKLTQTVRGGSLSLVTSNQYDLLGRKVSSTDPAGITTQYLYENLTNTTIRGGVTNVTVRYRDGNTCCSFENGVINSSYTYGVNDDGTRWTKVYTGSQGTNSPAWTKSTTDLLGRTISEEKPGFGGTVLTSTSVYNSQGRLIKTTRTSAPDTLYEYDELGNQIRSGSDVNGNGTLDLVGLDRINASDTSYQSDPSGNWWQTRTTLLYAGDNSATPTTNSIQKTRLTGHGSSSGFGILATEFLSTDLLGNQTTSRTYVDRSARTVTQTVTSPDSINAATQVTVNGLLATSTSKTGAQTAYTYDALGRQLSSCSSRSVSGMVGTITHYNALGQVDSTIDAASNTTTFAYDKSPTPSPAPPTPPMTIKAVFSPPGAPLILSPTTTMNPVA